MNLRTLLLAATAAGAALAGAGAADAANTPVSAQATATATIVAPSTLAATRGLSFGQIAKPTSGASTIKVASAAAASATPSITGGNAYVTTNGQAFAAAFHLTGTSAETYTINSTTLDFGAAATGNLANVASVAPVAAGGTVGTLPANGVDDLYIGGQFDISSSTAVQTYTGTLTLNVTYN